MAVPTLQELLLEGARGLCRTSSAARSHSSGKLGLVGSAATSVRSGEPNGDRLDSPGWACPTGQTGTRAPGGQSGCDPPLPPIWLRSLVLSELSAGFDAVLYIPHVVELIEQLLRLSSVVYQSWCLGRPRGMHNAASAELQGRDGYQRLERERGERDSKLWEGRAGRRWERRQDRIKASWMGNVV